MPSEVESKPWDFSQALELINTLSSPSPSVDKREPLYLVDRKDHALDHESNGTSDQASLGDFSRLWKYLGQPNDLPPPHAPALSTITPPDKPSYISDGAIYRSTSTKGVRWRDETEDNNSLTDNGAQDTGQHVEQQLTKTQRRKLRRKAQAEVKARQRTASDFESEADLPRTPARKASVHNVTPSEEHPQKRYRLRSSDSRSHIVTPTSSSVDIGQTLDFQVIEAVEETADEKAQTQELTPVKPHLINGTHRTPMSQTLITPKQSQQHILKIPVATPQSKNNVHPSQQLQAALQAGYQHHLPAHIAHTTSPAFNTVQQQPLWLQPGFLHPPAATTAAIANGKHQRTKPLVIREGDDRNLALRLKLIHDFGQEKKWLTSPVPLANHTHMANGLHVFIDYSNIWIGFMELVKRLAGLHLQARTPMKNLSFDSLVLLLERGRPVAKRVLAGSAPFLPAFDTAKAIGYELNILDKVFKAKELTERQRRFARKAAGHGGTTTTDEGSGSETGAAAHQAAYAPEKWVEQGVDEILHLKLLESIVDASDEEVSTIVLATGDAAEAEYSSGFMKMVERALKKGWKVELASWSQGMSHLYRKRDFLQKWEGKFSVVDLDDFADYLLDT